MPTVDFTLEDITGVVKTIVDQSIDTRFQVFETHYAEDMRAVQADFLQTHGRLDAMDARFDHYAHRTDKLLSQHSQDIMALRAQAT
jgi:hypothetical protein